MKAKFMDKSDKVSDIQKQANKIITAAYKNGGRVYFKDVKNDISADIQSINNILKGYGKLNVLLIDGSWYSFDLDLSNLKSKDSKLPDIFKKEKRGVWSKIWIGIFISVSAYFLIQLILWIVGRMQ